ncbi:phage major capsid protein, HK97 family [Luteitalea pratensis]|uniref:Phage major capsid protein, HK97 family n=1 Tax=Luteitalea pratensis TaxID=1855912 RepID=A0A143PU17_LUTPR|nr:phage major capsid protein [Luteitalea pratensis]AMY11294.1 phage major capsid protein, HK97 family [Luteitalea pratensis]
MFAAKHAARTLTEARTIHETADAANRDLTTEERSQYDSLMARARQYTTDAEAEAEASQALARFTNPNGSTPEFRSVVSDAGAGRTRSTASGIERRGLLRHEQAVWLPTSPEVRAGQSEGIPSEGGFAVPVQHLPEVIEAIRARSVFLDAEPRVFTMTSHVLNIPKAASGVLAGMVLEGAPIPQSATTFEQVVLTAQKGAVMVPASNEFLADAVPDGRAYIQQDLYKAGGDLFDTQAFTGNGTPPNVRGILNQPGIVTTPLVGAIDLDAIAGAIQRVEGANLTPSAIFLSSATWGALRLAKDGDTRYQLNPDPSGDAVKRLFGVPVFVTPHVGTACVVSDMQTIAVGIRNQVILRYDESHLFDRDSTVIRMTMRFDIGVLHTEGTQIITPGAGGTRAEVPAPAGKK